MASKEAPEYSHWLIIATTIFLIWTGFFAGVRLWSKLTRTLPWSHYDNIFSAALAIAVIQCITIFLAISYGFPPKANDSSSAKTLFASQTLYLVSIGLSKCSTALFLGNLTRNKRQKIPSIVIASICGVWTVASVFVIALRGDLIAPWTLDDGSESLYQRWLGVEASGLGLELALWVHSITLVWGLNMSILKRLKVISLFGLRLFIIAIVAGRLYFLHPNNNHLPSFANTLAYVFMEGAMLYSLIAECMTCLKPFLQPFHSGYGFTTKYGPGSFSNPSRDPYVEFSNISRTGPEPKKPLRVLERERRWDNESSSKISRQSSRRRGREQEDNKLVLHGDLSNFSAHIEANHKASAWSHNAQRKHSDEDDIELLHRQSAGIQQTTEISVIDERI